ncbi:pyruvate ferredoxin oxidoreductase delta subunit/pyruvate ferredoxin oxidoreductase gamma subunit [Ruminiclostridium sufflavum DSM 19573]|uniref:Pyruvate ferredoxin oxidoreductase delta subunit/pyruvate ferredoxin oxidoreductase gamma subunit n=1 Tax=Ruminiclostridium sufflavum DSM 19573 TaxID=1121337 RepID=A0A318XN72_9FIRM|nr:4Fe-4S binding protein [Ruminiclostridium sufflavum]PYG89452.1 pyruvate ferredoxin oxidoreductase delta subunit/pyruvate ferredoxin oxidoreductase gamma subunit [Ruminiclostridium sufflavum DSM 19573]
MKPFLRKEIPAALSELPDATAYEAGYLVTKNAGWRNVRPVIELDKCTGCLQCYLHCPDGVIFKDKGKVAVDYDFCKGCGICKKICKYAAIRMEAEK